MKVYMIVFTQNGISQCLTYLANNITDAESQFWNEFQGRAVGLRRIEAL